MLSPSRAANESPLTLPYHFGELLTVIEPPDQRKEIAQTIPADVRDFLKRSSEYPTITPHSRLIGSYGRSPAIHGIKDVDIVVFVPMAGDDDRPDPTETLSGLFNVLRGLPGELGYTGEATVRRRQRRSVHVHFAGADFHLDIVPALIPDGVEEPLLVPDKDWGRWVDSDPLGYGKTLSKLNDESGKKAVPLIKLFKHWRTVQMQRRRPKSYYLESLAYQHLQDGRVTTDGKSCAVLFADLLRSVHSDFLPILEGTGAPKIPDPMLGNNVAFNWEREAFETFMARLDDSIGWAERALAKDRDHMDEAIALWQKVFGSDYFVDSDSARQRQLAVWSEQRHISSTGRVTATAPAAGPSVISPPHRFYGDEQ